MLLDKLNRSGHINFVQNLNNKLSQKIINQYTISVISYKDNHRGLENFQVTKA